MEELLENLIPLYNKEFYLAYLCGEDVELPIPDGNTEHYLAYLCGMDVEIPDVPDGNNAHYLAYKCGQDVELPDPLYRIEFYLAKWCGVDCEVPEPMYRIEYWLAQLANSGELKTVTGNPISISDALAKPAESLTIEILPYQSGSGDPSPDNVRPISGFTGVNIYRESAFDPDADPTYAISWQDEAGTVYGGTLDVTTGVLTVTKAIVDLGNYSFVAFGPTPGMFYTSNLSGVLPNSVCVCSNYKYTNASIPPTRQDKTISTTNYFGSAISVYDTSYSDVATFTAAMSGVQLVYELATPLTYQLTATQVDMLLGNNVLWNDINGDMTLEYLADGPADDIDALNILLNNRYVNNGAEDEATDKEALEILLGGDTR